MRKRVAEWTYDGELLVTVESESEPGKTYDIRRTRGVTTCDCARYRFSKTPKDCKHLQAYRGVPAAIVAAAALPSVESVRVTVAAETFTVRRAITFGEVR